MYIHWFSLVNWEFWQYYHYWIRRSVSIKPMGFTMQVLLLSIFPWTNAMNAFFVESASKSPVFLGGSVKKGWLFQGSPSGFPEKNQAQFPKAAEKEACHVGLEDFFRKCVMPSQKINLLCRVFEISHVKTNIFSGFCDFSRFGPGGRAVPYGDGSTWALKCHILARSKNPRCFSSPGVYGITAV